MIKKKISKKREISFEDIQPIKLHSLDKFTDYKPSEFFKDEAAVGLALLQSLNENDTEAFMEILDAYLRVKYSDVAKKSNLTRATVYRAFSSKPNPTLKTIAKMVHYSYQENRKK